MTGLGEILSCYTPKLPQIERVGNDMHDVTVLVHLFVRLMYVCMYKGGPKTDPSTATFNDLLCFL
jgi:hypothetical protein